MKAVASKVQKARKPQARPGELFLLLCAGATAAPSFWCISAAVWAVLLVNSATTSRQQEGCTPGCHSLRCVHISNSRRWMVTRKSTSNRMPVETGRKGEDHASEPLSVHQDPGPAWLTSRKRKACKCTSRPSTRCPCIGSAKEGRGSKLTHIVSFLLLCNDCITGVM